VDNRSFIKCDEALRPARWLGALMNPDDSITIVRFVLAVFGLVLLTMFVTWVAYSTVQMLQRSDARDAAKAAAKAEQRALLDEVLKPRR
jgi:hypothetical protein